MIVAQIVRGLGAWDLLVGTQEYALGPAAALQRVIVGDIRVDHAGQGPQRGDVPLQASLNVGVSGDAAAADHEHIVLVDPGGTAAQGGALFDQREGIADEGQRHGHLHGYENGAELVAPHGGEYGTEGHYWA